MFQPSSSTVLLCTCGQPLKLPLPWLLHVKNGDPEVVKLMRVLNENTYEQCLEKMGLDKPISSQLKGQLVNFSFNMGILTARLAQCHPRFTLAPILGLPECRTLTGPHCALYKNFESMSVYPSPSLALLGILQLPRMLLPLSYGGAWCNDRNAPSR